MSGMIRPYAARMIFRAMLLLAAACLLASAQGCGKSIIGGDVGLPRYGKLSGPNVVKTARTQIGAPYKYGGASPRTGFDCSGLILWSYNQYGMRVPRLARDQAAAGKAVKRNDLRQGDIVVFRISARSGIHTGLYSGNGKFIHSPSTGKKIREDSLNAAYWKRRYVSARRVI